MRVRIYTQKEVQKVMDSGKIAYETHMYLSSFIKDGISTYDLDRLAHEYIINQKARPAFLGYSGYAFTLCTSLNDVVVHGLPNKKDVLKNGDIIGIDLGVQYHDYYSDTAWTWPVGNVSDDIKKLLAVTQESLYKGITQANEKNRIGAIGEIVQSFVEANSFSVVTDYVGHGIGASIHELPQVPNYGKKKDGLPIKSGMILAIEPMVNVGKSAVYTDTDKWTVRTVDGSLSAHFEHTIIVTSNGPVIATLPLDAVTDVFSILNKD